MTIATIGLHGAPFVGISLFQMGLRDVCPAQVLHVGSGPILPYLPLADAWIWLHDEARDAIPAVLATGKPVVSRSIPTLALGLPVVHMDDEVAARRLAEQQIAAGARRLVYWGMPASFSQRRAAGVAAAAAAAGLAFTETTSLETTVAALRGGPTPVGCVGMNDAWCHQIAAALHGSDLQLRRQVLLAGFDNTPMPLEPWAIPLTTVVLPMREQGRLAARLLTGHQPIPLAIHTTPPPTILLRDSTRSASSHPCT